MDLDLDASWWEKRKRKRGERERDDGQWWTVVNFGRCGEWRFEGVKYGGPTWERERERERERDEKNMNLFSFGEKVLLPKEMSKESMLKFFG